MAGTVVRFRKGHEILLLQSSQPRRTIFDKVEKAEQLKTLVDTEGIEHRFGRSVAKRAGIGAENLHQPHADRQLGRVIVQCLC